MTAAAPTLSPVCDIWPQTKALLLLADGRAVVLARNAAPLPEVVAATAARLVGLGLAGWLAGVELRGPGHRPRLRRFRQVIDGAGTWEAAMVAFVANWTARATVRSAPPRKLPTGKVEGTAIGGVRRAEPEPPTSPDIPRYLLPSAALRRRASG